MNLNSLDNDLRKLILLLVGTLAILSSLLFYMSENDNWLMRIILLVGVIIVVFGVSEKNVQKVVSE